jgi:hypothetical protein
MQEMIIHLEHETISVLRLLLKKEVRGRSPGTLGPITDTRPDTVTCFLSAYLFFFLFLSMDFSKD